MKYSKKHGCKVVAAPEPKVVEDSESESEVKEPESEVKEPESEVEEPLIETYVDLPLPRSYCRQL